MGRNQLISTTTTLPDIQAEIEAVEKQMLTQADEYNGDLKSALSLLLSSGGKRIRPRVILLLGNILKANRRNLNHIGFRNRIITHCHFSP